MSELKDIKAKILKALDEATDEMVNTMRLSQDGDLYKKVEALAHSYEMLDACDPIWTKEEAREDLPSASPHFEVVIDLLEKRVEYLRPKACTLGDYWTGVYEAYDQMLKDINEAIGKDEEYAKVRGEEK